jgi:hypothetical protein
MIRIQDFLNQPQLWNHLPPEVQVRIQDPAEAEWLIRNFLLEPGDRLEIKKERVEPGEKITYLITEPSGKWYRLHFLKRDQPGEPRPEELSWLDREREKLEG